MDSIHNEGKSVAAERFIRTFKAKIYKCMISISKTVYISKLDDIVNQHNNTYHRTIKMKPVDVKDNTYIDSVKAVNNKDPKFKDLINDLNGEEIIRTFYEKELQKTNQQEFRIEKVIKKRVISYMSNGKVMIHIWRCNKQLAG